MKILVIGKNGQLGKSIKQLIVTNENANNDDGSCAYPCLASDTAESFESGAVGGGWIQLTSDSHQWTVTSNGTP